MGKVANNDAVWADIRFRSCLWPTLLSSLLFRDVCAATVLLRKRPLRLWRYTKRVGFQKVGGISLSMTHVVTSGGSGTSEIEGGWESMRMRVKKKHARSRLLNCVWSTCNLIFRTFPIPTLLLTNISTCINWTRCDSKLPLWDAWHDLRDLLSILR